MTYKVQKIREEVARIQLYTQSEVLKQVLEYIDKVQEEPVSNPTPNERMNKERFAEACRAACCDRNYRSHYGHTETRDDYFVDGVQWADEHPKEEPVSEDLEVELSAYVNSEEYINSIGTSGLLLIARHFANWQKQQDAIPVDDDLDKAAEEYAQEAYNHPIDREVGKADFILGAQWKEQKESIPSKDLEELISSLYKRYPKVSFAKLSRIAVRVAKWQKEHLWKPADGDDLPEIDREVIALLDKGKVVFAHRPPEYWDGKDIVTCKVTRHYPKTYGKGGWNIPDIVYWLDVNLPKEIEL